MPKALLARCGASGREFSWRQKILNVPGGAAERGETSPALGPEDERVAATIGNWKRRLLDVSKRNRALSFKPNKVTTVAIVDEQPAEVFRQLYLQERQMRFLPAPPKTEAPQALPATQDAGTGAEEEVEDNLPSPDFIPYAPSELGARHTDDRLQTSAPAESLDKSLRRIADQAQASIEEQGVNTLFLALGMLHYKESPASEEMFRAPLVLLPVVLQRKSARAGYTVEATDDDPMVNPALAEYLRRSFGIQLPDLPDLANLPEQYDLQQLFVETTRAIANQTGWHVKTDIHLSFLSFQKFVMYKDLEVNAAAFGAHPLVRQVILRSGSSLCALPEEIRAAELDAEFPPEGTAQVVNADSSQLRAILAVSRGHDLVLEGPPGTGKSQTITNLIAQALSREQVRALRRGEDGGAGSRPQPAGRGGTRRVLFGVALDEGEQAGGDAGIGGGFRRLFAAACYGGGSDHAHRRRPRRANGIRAGRPRAVRHARDVAVSGLRRT